MEIFEAVESIFSVMFEFVYEHAFCKENTLKKRLPYLLLYYFVFVSFFLIFMYVIFHLIVKRNMVILGCFISIIPILCLTAIFYPVIKK